MRCRTAYLCFLDDVRARVTEENKDLKMIERTKIMAKMWKELDDEGKQVGSRVNLTHWFLAPRPKVIQAREMWLVHSFGFINRNTWTELTKTRLDSLRRWQATRPLWKSKVKQMTSQVRKGRRRIQQRRNALKPVCMRGRQ